MRSDLVLGAFADRVAGGAFLEDLLALVSIAGACASRNGEGRERCRQSEGL
jgi:hypothetical protein